MSDDDYYTIRSVEAATGRAGRSSPLIAAFLFAAVAVGVSVLTVPHVGSNSRFAARQPLGLDPIMTGSIRPGSAPGGGLIRRDATQPGKTYIVRRSVLTGGSVCVIGQDGNRSGSC